MTKLAEVHDATSPSANSPSTGAHPSTLLGPNDWSPTWIVGSAAPIVKKPVPVTVVGWFSCASQIRSGAIAATVGAGTTVRGIASVDEQPAGEGFVTVRS